MIEPLSVEQFHEVTGRVESEVGKVSLSPFWQADMFSWKVCLDSARLC